MHSCITTRTLLQLHMRTLATPHAHSCNTTCTLLQHHTHTLATPHAHSCNTTRTLATPQAHSCYTIRTLLQYYTHTLATLHAHSCNTTRTLLLHHTCTLAIPHAHACKLRALCDCHSLYTPHSATLVCAFPQPRPCSTTPSFPPFTTTHQNTSPHHTRAPANSGLCMAATTHSRPTLWLVCADCRAVQCSTAHRVPASGLASCRLTAHEHVEKCVCEYV